ncbi:MAG: hypothetical protein K0R38_7129, partial [Polyangiaceae bacterium]|nr:hypothetical protein [Polyangiaceae bacterium]
MPTERVDAPAPPGGALTMSGVDGTAACEDGL